jgi:DNA topoisomerase-3
VCERSVPTAQQPTPSCDFKSGQVILQQAIAPEQMGKLLASGQTDVLEGFVSARTRRPFKARLAWNAEEGKVGFAFEPREGARKYPPRKTASVATKTRATGAALPGPPPRKPLPRKPRPPKPPRPRAPARCSPARRWPPPSAPAPSAAAR